MDLSAGERIDDYVVEEVIGEGGMAIVARARHVHHQHRVAIKLMRPEAARTKDVVQRFEREQRTLGRLYSDHTVRFYGAGQHRGKPYMVLELLRGRDLEESLKRDGPLPAKSAVLYLLQACHSIAEAHAQGIIHRDLKPSNLFLTKRDDGSPCVKVLDFGISKDTAHSSAEEPSLTMTQHIVGSPWYMSPEQLLSSKHVDTGTDLWALGVTLYQLLSMNIPFAAESTAAVVQRILADEPTPLRRVSGHIAPELEAVVMRCLQRRRAERWASVADLATALAPFGPDYAAEALSRIYELVPPSGQRAPISTPASAPEQPASASPAGGRATRGDAEETLYLRKESGGSGGISGWLSAAAALGMFALGGGLGWVLSLDTDPTSATRPRPPAAIGELPAPAQQAPSALSQRSSAQSEPPPSRSAEPPSVAVIPPSPAPEPASLAVMPPSPAVPAPPAVARGPASAVVGGGSPAPLAPPAVTAAPAPQPPAPPAPIAVVPAPAAPPRPPPPAEPAKRPPKVTDIEF